jgi:hypothetical protein
VFGVEFSVKKSVRTALERLGAADGRSAMCEVEAAERLHEGVRDQIGEGQLRAD